MRDGDGGGVEPRSSGRRWLVLALGLAIGAVSMLAAEAQRRANADRQHARFQQLSVEVADALAYREANTHEIGSFDAFASGVEEQGGFWIGAWCGDAACEAEISAKTKASIRFLPLVPRDPGGACMHCGKPGVDEATWARAY